MGLTVVDLDGRARRQPAPAEPQRKRLLYEDVIDLVARIVAEQQLAPGDKLPTHAELAELAGVSMITVRRALEELERRGQVRRHQGLGTFLARPRIVSEPGRTGGLRDTFSVDQDARPERHELASAQRGTDAVTPDGRDQIVLLAHTVLADRAQNHVPTVAERTLLRKARSSTVDGRGSMWTNLRPQAPLPPTRVPLHPDSRAVTPRLA